MGRRSTSGQGCASRDAIFDVGEAKMCERRVEQTQPFAELGFRVAFGARNRRDTFADACAHCLYLTAQSLFDAW